MPLHDRGGGERPRGDRPTRVAPRPFLQGSSEEDDAAEERDTLPASSLERGLNEVVRAGSTFYILRSTSTRTLPFTSHSWLASGTRVLCSTQQLPRTYEYLSCEYGTRASVLVDYYEYTVPP